MSVTLPVRSDVPHYSVDVELDGIRYTFAFRWNDRAGAWFMDIGTPEGVALLSGLRLVVEYPLTARATDPRLPPGQFIAVDTSGERLDPGLNDLGARVLLLYYSPEELA